MRAKLSASPPPHNPNRAHGGHASTPHTPFVMVVLGTTIHEFAPQQRFHAPRYSWMVGPSPTMTIFRNVSLQSLVCRVGGQPRGDFRHQGRVDVREGDAKIVIL